MSPQVEVLRQLHDLVDEDGVWVGPKIVTRSTSGQKRTVGFHVHALLDQRLDLSLGVIDEIRRGYGHQPSNGHDSEASSS